MANSSLDWSRVTQQPSSFADLSPERRIEAQIRLEDIKRAIAQAPFPPGNGGGGAVTGGIPEAPDE